MLMFLSVKQKIYGLSLSFTYVFRLSVLQWKKRLCKIMWWKKLLWQNNANYVKLDHWVMQFKNFHCLTLHEPVHYMCIWLGVKLEVFLYIETFPLLLQNKFGKIYLKFWAFLIKQLFHLCLLDMRWFSQLSHLLSHIQYTLVE